MKNRLLLSIFLLGAITVSAQAKYVAGTDPVDRYSSALFHSADAQILDLENESNKSAISFFNVLDWVKGRVAGLQVYHYRGTPIPFLRNQPAVIYVDEIRVDPGYLNALPVTDISYIKIMKNAFAIYSGGGGVIAIYTKRGEGEEEEEG